ncbi:MAG: formate--tetrahydrofolate ligase [Chloroflexota bacterium]|nr:formate--tetrahydrofolate ligase [Chloroflexota bacterium]
MKPITEIADELGIDNSYLIPYGKYKAKIDLSAIRPEARGKLVVITGITPTRAGEGKTTTTVGLTQGLGKLGHKVAATLREPSLGPVFGIKGGGTGGDKSKIVPEDEVNIHFTGDAHAVGSAHNLLAAMTDNVAQRSQIAGFSPSKMTWRRVTDVEDRALRTIVTGIGGSANAPMRETGFDIVTASEVMAILALSEGLDNLRNRLSNIVVGFTDEGQPVTAGDVGAVGSMMSLLRHAILPNIVQTTEGQPVFVHTGPFGNIAHGCSSVIGDKLALGYADYVLTEAGFGADLGFEKFMHIKARFNGLEPQAAVLVASVRAIKSHGGVKRRELEVPDTDAVSRGVPVLEHLVKMISSFGIPVVVAINKFASDTQSEISIVKARAEAAGANAAVESRSFSEGGAGCTELAEALISATQGGPKQISYAYALEQSIEEKITALAQKVYNASGINLGSAAQKNIRTFESFGWDKMPICMAKTHLSISHDPKARGVPCNYNFEVSDARASVGAGFIFPLAGTMVTMPGLPGSPRVLDVDRDGNVTGL